MDNGGLIRGPSIGKESCLSKADDLLKKGLNSVNNYFGNNFVGGITKDNKSEALEIGSIPTLGDEA